MDFVKGSVEELVDLIGQMLSDEVDRLFVVNDMLGGTSVLLMMIGAEKQSDFDTKDFCVACMYKKYKKEAAKYRQTIDALQRNYVVDINCLTLVHRHLCDILSQYERSGLDLNNCTTRLATLN